jgi:hypothetical protein
MGLELAMPDLWDAMHRLYLDLREQKRDEVGHWGLVLKPNTK